MVRRRSYWRTCLAFTVLAAIALRLGQSLFVWNAPGGDEASGEQRADPREGPAAHKGTSVLAVRTLARKRGRAFEVTRAEAFAHSTQVRRRESSGGGGGSAAGPAHAHSAALALEGLGGSPLATLRFSYSGARTRACYENLTDTPLEPHERFALFDVLEDAAFGLQCSFRDEHGLHWGDAACGPRDDVLAHFVGPVDGFPRLSLSGSFVPRPSSRDPAEISLITWHVVRVDDESLSGLQVLDSGAFSTRGGALLHGRASLRPGVVVEGFAKESLVGLIARHSFRAAMPAPPGARVRIGDELVFAFATADAEGGEKEAAKEAEPEAQRPPWAPPRPAGPGVRGAGGYFDPRKPNLIRACDANRYKSGGITRESFAKAFEGYTVWSIDLHAAPIMCSAEVYEHMGMRVDAQIDSVTCKHYKGRRVCAEELKVFAMGDGVGPGIDVCAHRMRRDFFDAYKSDPRMQRVDAFVCSHPAANCELLLPFNRSVIVYATTRLEFGRFDDNIDWRWRHADDSAAEKWRAWVAALQKLAADPRNTVAANSLYDALYIRQLTGVPALYIPSWCGYTAREAAAERRAPRAEVVVVPNRINTLGHVPGERWRHPLFSSLDRWMRRHQSRTGRLHDIRFLNELYPRGYDFADLAAHPAMVAIPYQLSLMSFFEYYRVGVPMFFPAIPLLVQWEADYHLTWERIYGHPEPQADPFTPFDPNSESCDDFVSWLQYADFYSWPHLIYFDSWEHLLHLLDTTDLAAVSAAMRAENECIELQILESWRDVMSRAFGRDPPGSREIRSDFYAAMGELGYEAVPPDSNPACWPP